ncbi:unnamed protein product, partial [Symbiodinium pilosum]
SKACCATPSRNWGRLAAASFTFSSGGRHTAPPWSGRMLLWVRFAVTHGSCW